VVVAGVDGFVLLLIGMIVGCCCDGGDGSVEEVVEGIIRLDVGTRIVAGGTKVIFGIVRTVDFGGVVVVFTEGAKEFLTKLPE
jgi:ABC-type proline/glycine betaine transport system permease subunit